MATLEIITDPIQSSRQAGLRYVTDAKPGFTRKKRGKSFQYFDTDGKRIKDEDTLRRIKSLVIPPAWTDVWICPAANGHLQATGRDARGRKQSRYHPRWREVRDETKYERMKLFGAALPKIRDQVERDLALSGLPREKVLATIVRLLETTFIRIGNEEYAKENQSYGLTTLRNKHVDVEGSKVHFKFKGKSGKMHSIDVQDRQLARIVKKCQDVPGYELFQYIDEEGNHRSVDASDVNDYLRAITEDDFTAKDFRTWAGTVLACSLLRQFEASETQAQTKKNVVEAIKTVAERLGNTPSVCRKCYVHPRVIESYMSGTMVKAFEDQVKAEVAKTPHELRQEELDVLHLLEEKAKLAA
ncbi:DNA topoisomerase IB [Occallatibacter riparius]|uniref:DNA topoisomerase n=1 Tax=Occallatibacter riparius TaxID=1002689 RepID=A0A9J7BHW4_9BACT|nr:DNA topoisomerase IB [Occallatibacter riparius]UWZ82043.1 DNA topoisomerase IB [Occallatibacter riparius]